MEAIVVAIVTGDVCESASHERAASTDTQLLASWMIDLKKIRSMKAFHAF
jgi:hypothetical protein